MSTLWIVMVIVFSAMQSIMQKQYNKKTDGRGIFAFCAAAAPAAMLVFLLTAVHPLSFTPKILPFSLAFSLSHASAVLFSVLALRCGPMAITLLITSYSLLIPTAYGIFFLHNPVSLTLAVGIVLLLVSLALINRKKESGEGATAVKPSGKWLIFVTLAFIGNGMCSTVQNIQIQVYEGAYKSEFMLTALCISFVVMLCATVLFERKERSAVLRCGAVYAVLYGLFNGLVNFLVILLLQAGELPNTVIFPCISAGGMILTFLAAVFLYKEKMSKTQIAGFFIGVGSVIFLNI